MAEYAIEQNLRLAEKMLEQQGEINALRYTVTAQQARMDAAVALHSELPILDGVDTYSICSTCCTDYDQQSEHCATDHDHSGPDACWPCPTRRALTEAGSGDG